MADVMSHTSEFGQSGANKSNLMKKANLSHSRLNGFLKNLIGSGLINSIVYENHQTYVLTPKGINFLHEYQKFVELSGAFGLEL
jgi:predicted transcriptional regulator